MAQDKSRTSTKATAPARATTETETVDVQGLPGASGPAWRQQPTAAELFAKVREAAFAFSPRTLVDPRAGARYLTNLTARLIKLQGGVVLRAVVTTDLAVDPTIDRAPLRSIS